MPFLFACLDVLLGDDVDDAAGREPELGDDRQAHEAQGHEGVDLPADAQVKV